MAKKEQVPAVAEPSGIAKYDYGKDAGEGFEGTHGNELAIPFLNILQANSPQVEEETPPGSKAGMFYNTVTQEVMEGEKAGIVFLPCYKQTMYVEWVPRDSGGGFVGMHAPETDLVKQAIGRNGGRTIGKLTAGSNELVETHYVYGLILSADGKVNKGFAVLSFTSTKMKPYRNWLTSMYMIKGRPPLFAFRTRLRTVKQKNTKGAFYNFRIEPFADTWVNSLIDPKQDENLLVEGKSFREMVMSGVAQVSFDQQESVADATDPEAPPF